MSALAELIDTVDDDGPYDEDATMRGTAKDLAALHEFLTGLIDLGVRDQSPDSDDVTIRANYHQLQGHVEWLVSAVFNLRDWSRERGE